MKLPSKEQLNTANQYPFVVFSIVLTAAVVYLFFWCRDLNRDQVRYMGEDRLKMVNTIEQNTQAFKAFVDAVKLNSLK